MDKVNFVAGIITVVIGYVIDDGILMLAGVVVLNSEYAVQRIIREMRK